MQPGDEHPRRKTRRAGSQPTLENQISSPGNDTDKSSPSSSAASVEPQTPSLPPDLSKQLVNRVADEVSRRLSPPDDPRSISISHTPMPSAFSELRLDSTSPGPVSVAPVPGASITTTGMVGAIMHASTHSAFLIPKSSNRC